MLHVNNQPMPGSLAGRCKSVRCSVGGGGEGHRVASKNVSTAGGTATGHRRARAVARQETMAASHLFLFFFFFFFVRSIQNDQELSDPSEARIR